MNENSSVGPKPEINVSMPERLLSGLAGYWLLRHTLSRKHPSLLLAALGGYLLYRGTSGHCPGYSALGRKRLPDPVKNINIRTRMVVNRPRHEVYAFWRRLENLPLFMEHLAEVVEADSRRSHWKAKVPGGLGTISWKAEIVKEEDGLLLGWNSLPGATIENAGKVEFRDAGDSSTELTVVISYRAPLGIAGAGISQLLNPLFESIIREDIHRFKEYIEEAHISGLDNITATQEDRSTPREGTAPAFDDDSTDQRLPEETNTTNATGTGTSVADALEP